MKQQFIFWEMHFPPFRFSPFCRALCIHGMPRFHMHSVTDSWNIIAVSSTNALCSDANFIQSRIFMGSRVNVSCPYFAVLPASASVLLFSHFGRMAWRLWRTMRSESFFLAECTACRPSHTFPRKNDKETYLCWLFNKIYHIMHMLHWHYFYAEF